MRKILALLGCLAVAGAAHAANTVYNTTLVKEPGLAYNNTYPLDVNSYHIDTLSMMAVSSGTSLATLTFNDGVKSTGTITVVSTTAIHGVQGTDTLTVVSGKNGGLAAAAATDIIDVVTNTTGAFQGASVNVNGTVLSYNKDWFIGTSSNSTATSIANAIAANTNFSTSVTGGSVTVTCATNGSFCNAYTLTSSTQAALHVNTATFTGGQDATFFTLNGYVFTNGQDWFTGLSSTNTAASMVTDINGNANVNATFVASASSNVVTISCASSGTFCNAYTLTTSSPVVLSTGSATFTGGVNNGLLSINGIVLTEQTDFNAVTSSAVAANNIATAINANSALSAIITSTAPLACGLTNKCGVIITTSTAVGSGTNYSLWTSSNAALKPFAPAMRGGSDSSFNTTTDVITIASHGLPLAFPVLYTTTTGTAPGGLTTGTTYFAIPIDANTFKLSTTSTGAVAGVAVDITSDTGSGTFSLKPLSFTAPASGKWQGSNDNSNWFDLSVSSISQTNTTQQIVNWDLSNYNYQYIRFNAVAPTQGGWNIVINVNGKTSQNVNRP